MQQNQLHSSFSCYLLIYEEKTTTENLNVDFYVIPVKRYKEKGVIYPFVDLVTDSCHCGQQDKRLQSEFQCHNSWLFTSLTICHLHTHTCMHTQRYWQSYLFSW